MEAWDCGLGSFLRYRKREVVVESIFIFVADVCMWIGVGLVGRHILSYICPFVLSMEG